MKKFRFQLDTVLGYKQQVLDNRLVEHGAADTAGGRFAGRRRAAVQL